ncbi:MAG: RsmB/NOP family class SAM-dependent methyltransferase [Alphaproteobacteria bacterium]|nr:RsmB/NOP family class SAM-dependent methyltransferase [Alphaproteobacteria bacterium]
MNPAARVQAAIELLDQVVDAARAGGAAADTLIQRYFQTRRYAGSKDRRAVRELVYRGIRASAEAPVSGRAAILALSDPALDALFDGSPHGPVRIADGEGGSLPSGSAVPQWLAERLDPVVTPDEWSALLDRAPLDLRVNRLKGGREGALAALPEAIATPLSPLGIRLPDGFRVEELDAWRSGLVEVQDEGSQLLALACDASADMLVLDLCAGAGGKTLALGAEMGDRGKLIAADIDRGRLGRMQPRLSRAGLHIVEARLLDPKRERTTLRDLEGRADVVLVDAPCSGTGTWRRNPELRWRLTADRLDRLVRAQADLLDLAAELVRPGGLLVYAVCSLLAEEGRGQAANFGLRSSLVADVPAMEAGREAGTGRILTPGHDGTDGFFVARWRAPC